MASRAAQARAAAKAAAEDGVSLTVSIDGKKYRIAQQDMTAIDVREMRAQTGHSFQGLIRELSRDADIDLLAAVVWLSRRSEGERRLTYDEVAAGIDYDADFTVVADEAAAAEPVVPGAGEDDSPEA